jgi:hypothetical protein
MSFNRFHYDGCEFIKEQILNRSTLNYMLDHSRYENNSKCRHELGLVGGTAVSHNNYNLVDVETELRGQSRSSSLCPSKYYPYVKFPISETKLHLPSCQMIRYKSINLPITPLNPICEPQNLRWYRK